MADNASTRRDKNDDADSSSSGQHEVHTEQCRSAEHAKFEAREEVIPQAYDEGERSEEEHGRDQVQRVRRLVRLTRRGAVSFTSQQPHIPRKIERRCQPQTEGK
eukprot:5519705-Prymnesium_polylepis.1